MPSPLPNSAELWPFLPELLLAMAVLGMLLIPIVLRRQNGLLVPIGAAAGLVAALVALAGIWPQAMGAPASYFGGMLLLDPFAWTVQLLVIGFALMVMALWFTDSHDKCMTRGQAEDAPEFFALLLGSVTGMCLMAATRNLLVLFVAMQLAWFPCCVLAAFRRDHAAGSLGAMKLVIFAAAAAAVTVYGMSLLYGLFGTLDAGQIGELLGQGQWHERLGGASGMALALALMLIVLGIGTVAAAAPACFWMPEVFEAANIDVAAFLSVAPVIAGLAALLRILSAIGGGAASAAALGWLPFAIAAIGAMTCLCGALGALSQTNIKRLLAWSGIAHAGFMLIGMAAVVSPENPAGPGPAGILGGLESPAASMLLFYLLMYVFMNGGAMIAAAAIAQRLTGPFDAGMSLGVDKIISAAPPRKAVRETGEEIGQYAGLSRRAPILSAVMLVFLLSLAGVPLTAGFAAKVKLLGVLFDLPAPLSWAAVAIVGIGTVVLAFSYFRVVRQMYLVESEAPRLIEIAPVTVVALVLVIPSVALFVGYGVVDRLAAGQARMVGPAVVRMEAPGSGDGR